MYLTGMNSNDGRPWKLKQEAENIKANYYTVIKTRNRVKSYILHGNKNKKHRVTSSIHYFTLMGFTMATCIYWLVSDVTLLMLYLYSS